MNGENGQSRRVISEQTIQLEKEFNSEEPIDVEIDNAFPMHRTIPTSDELEKHGISFVSTQPRLFFPYDLDDEALRNSIRQQMDTDNRHDSYRHRRFLSFMGRDISTSCVSCDIEITIDNETETYTRKMNLNTLHHGSFHILVTDIRCPKHPIYISHDGFGDAIFCLNRTQAFTRELLDPWIMDICDSGGTFRDAFISWASKSATVSAEIIHIVNTPTINRQRCNEAFTSFLMTLRFPKSQDLC